MKLASLNRGRDGELVVVARDLSRYCSAADIAPTLQRALDQWEITAPKLQARFDALQQNQLESTPFSAELCHSPLPRAFHWADGSAYVNHVELVRKARGAEMPQSFWTDPLMYQGGSDMFLAPTANIAMASTDWGIDFEAEIAVVTDDVTMGTNLKQAAEHIQLIMLVNDVSLRNLIPGELGKGFGFYQSKPSSAFSPVAVTPDELSQHWHDGKLHLDLHAIMNGEKIGSPNAGVDMTFNFPQLIAHAAKSRPLGSGTIIGSGTVSNIDRSAGSCCLAEVRMLETIQQGKPSTPFMQYGDHIEIAMYDENGSNIFGSISQQVVPYNNP
ncbi:MAG: fumarylacetoacetate hydrolase family protein [Gammaproteobacteria bacterium]|nr:fumarylacetoacetate hydrolase family protein [Gammaproteobacteria bacterium]